MKCFTQGTGRWEGAVAAEIWAEGSADVHAAPCAKTHACKSTDLSLLRSHTLVPPYSFPMHSKRIYITCHMVFSLQQPHQKLSPQEAALRAHRSSLPQWQPWHLPVQLVRPHCFTFRNCVSYFNSFSCKVYLWRDTGVKLKKDLIWKTASWGPVSGYSLSGKEPTYKPASGSEGESFSMVALVI